MVSGWPLPVLVMTTLYQAGAADLKKISSPRLFKEIDVGNHRLPLMHLPSTNAAGANQPTVVINHSLGGVEGYLLAEMIAPETALHPHRQLLRHLSHAAICSPLF